MTATGEDLDFAIRALHDEIRDVISLHRNEKFFEIDAHHPITWAAKLADLRVGVRDTLRQTTKEEAVTTMTLAADEPQPGAARRLRDAYRQTTFIPTPEMQRMAMENFRNQPTDVCYDTEFIDDGKTIELVSIGLIKRNRESYYAVNADMDQERVLRHPFLRDHVWSKLPLRELAEPYALVLEEGEYYPDKVVVPPGGKVEILVTSELDLDHPDVKPRARIAEEVLAFLVPEGWDAGKNGAAVRLWAWFASYDHVALAQLWGAMVRMPRGVPMRTGDLAQEAERLGVPKEVMPPQDEKYKHHALADAEHDWVIKLYLEDHARRHHRG